MSLERLQIVGAPTNRVVYPLGLFKKTLVKGTPDLPENYKYNALILVPKDDEEKSNQIAEAYNEAFKALQAKGFPKKSPSAINPNNNCLLDGDKLADEDEKKEAFRGYWIVKVASKNFRPIVTDMSKLVILNDVPIAGLAPSKISPRTLEDGDYVFASISFWVYFNSSFQGIGCNVHAVIRAKAGERIGGASGDVDDYVDIEGYEVEEDDFNFETEGDDKVF